MTSWTHEKVSPTAYCQGMKKKTLKTQRDVCSTQHLNINWDGSQKGVFLLKGED